MPEPPQASSATPLLDLERPLPQRLRQPVTFFEGLTVLCSAVMLFGMPSLLSLIGVTSPQRTLDALLEDLPRHPLVSIASILLGWYTLVLIHELGHVMAGRVVGMQCQSVSVGPLRVVRIDNRWKLQFERVLWYGGFAILDPVSPNNLRWRLLAMTFGGLVANLLFGVSVLVTSAYLPPDVRFGMSSIGGLAGFSIGLGLASLFPYKDERFVPDGNSIWMLLRNNTEGKRHLAIVRLTMATAAGQRYREWDPALVSEAVSLADGSPQEAAGKGLCYAYECDRKNVQGAALLLERLLQLTAFMPFMRDYLVIEAAFFQAWYRRDLARAQSWWHRGEKKLKKLPPHSRFRAEAGLLFVQGKHSEAMQKIDASLHEIRKMPDSRFRMLYEQNWLEWKDELLEREQEAQKSAQSAAAV